MKPYKFLDRDDLYAIIDSIEEAVSHIHNAEDALEGVEFVGKASILAELTDVVNDLYDELPDVQAAAADKDKEEEKALNREYYRSVV